MHIVCIGVTDDICVYCRTYLLFCIGLTIYYILDTITLI